MRLPFEHGIRLLLPCLICILLDGTITRGDEKSFASAVRPTEPLTPDQEQLALHVPDGFRIELFAAEPDIQKPLNMAFDSQGRMWLSGTEDYPFPNLNEPGDSIRVLEDTNGDGQADRCTLFADKITMPLGILPYEDGVIAFCLPNIWFLRDTDGDGHCDQRELLYGPFDYARDTHGLNNAFRRGFDGWIYACHGFSNQSVVTGKDGNTVRMSSGNTYRFRPDGSRIEHFTFGQVNPFGMTFDARGDLFNSDCHTKPLTFLMRGGEYGGFGRKHDGLGFVPAIMHHSHGSTAIAGATQLTDERIPDEFRDQYLAGNVMTSRVNRDALAHSGSSMQAVEQPDFIISDDPWFRPVDLQMGPDGAIYIADFYNKIIGHYEVPLQHPGRDRHRGRIWRVVPVDKDGSAAKLKDVVNLKTATLPEIVKAAGTRNLPRQLKAIDELSDRLGPAAAPELLKFLAATQNDTTRISLLWALHRMHELPESHLVEALHASAPLVRTHAQHLLEATPHWSDELRDAALSGLDDPDQFVQRAAAAALAWHPHASQVQPLLERWLNAPQDDPLLVHQLKIALRNQLQLPEVLTQAAINQLPSSERMSLVEICMGVDTPEAAHFMLSQYVASPFLSDQPEALVERMAKWTNTTEQQRLIQAVQSQCLHDPETELKLLQAMRRGQQQQQVTHSAPLQTWAEELVTRVISGSQQAHLWTSTNKPSTAPAPWGYEPRTSSNGTPAIPFLSSHFGGEQAVSTLRSPEFTIPSQLSFDLCGHLGFPGQPASEKNYVRLCLVNGDKEIRRAVPPRHDVAQRVRWELAEIAGQKGYLEIVDGMDASAYAWLAISQIDPAVISLPAISPAAESRLLIATCELAGELGMQERSADLVSVLKDSELSIAVRAQAAATLARFEATPIASGLAALCRIPSLTTEQRARTITALLDHGLLDHDSEVNRSEESRVQTLGEMTRPLAARYQIEIAQAILSHDGGAPFLLQLCESGMLSPRILTSSAIHPRIVASHQKGVHERLKSLLETLPAETAQRDKRIQSLVKIFSQKQTAPASGRKVFEARCAACHQIQGVGKLIGPQLDGIGSRGSERLFEDILDPNRNVDQAFRSRTYALANGQIYSGVFRRQEGQLIVIADNKGEEHSFLEQEIEDQAIASMSIMPDNWDEIIPEQDLLALMSFLLEQKK